MSPGVPTGDSKSLLSGFTPAGAGDTCSSSDSWQDLGAMLDVGQELERKEVGWNLPCVPGVGNPWGSLWVSERPRQHLPALSEGIYTGAYPTGHRTAGHMSVLLCMFQARTAGHLPGSTSQVCTYIPCCLLFVPLELSLELRSEVLSFCL